MRKVTRALVGAIVASLVAAAVCRDADGGRFRRLQYGRAGRHDGGHRHFDDKGLRARGVSPDGQRSEVDHVGRADQDGVLGSPADWDGDRWDHGRRVSGDISHVHATEWILRRFGRKRESGWGRVPIGTGTAPVPGALDQAALTSIVLGIAACGVGTLTWSMPFAYFASTRAASTPSGSAKLRWNAPYATSRTKYSLPAVS